MKVLRHIGSIGIIVFTAFFCSSFTTIEQSFNSDYESDAKAEKVVSKEFSYSNATSLEVNHSYGSIKVAAWKSDKVVVSAYVKYDPVVSDTKAYAAKNYKIDVSQKGSNICISTKHLGKDIKHTINYVVYAPASIATKINVSYGDIALGNLTGKVNVSLSYGDLYAEKLSYGNAKQANNISVKYGDVSIKETEWLNLDIHYGNFNLHKGFALGLNGTYSDFKVDEAKFVNLSLSYSDLKFGALGMVKGDLTHSDIVTDRADSYISLNLLYSNISAYNISPSFKGIFITSRYGDGKLGFRPKTSFNLDVTSTYADIKLYDANSGIQKLSGSFQKNIGSTPTNNKVRISCTYGNWSMKLD